MKKLFICLALICSMVIPVNALEFHAPTAPGTAQQYMPENTESFSDGLFYILKSAVMALHPSMAKVSGVCLSLIATVLLMRTLSNIASEESNAIRVTGAVVIGLILLDPINSMIQLGTDTVTEMSEYGKLLLPVMTAAMAAQGGTTSSAALYTGTVVFNTFLTTFIARIMVPALYIFLCICIAGCAVKQEMLDKIRDFVKWAMTWCLKIVLYVFTGYMSITGVVSGTVDASALKAAKLTISGAVPVIGNVLSDTSEAILVSAGIMKNTAGVYGILAITAMFIGPFLEIGVQYLLLKITGAICNMFGNKQTVELVGNFTTGMGIILGMTGTVCVLLLISLVCFMRGMS